MSTPIIQLNDVEVTYRTGLPIFRQRQIHQVLKGISLEVLQGESLGIIGRNGAGKSTLLRLLNGIIKPDRGEVIRKDIRTVLLSLTVGYDPNVSGRDNAIMQGMLLGFTEREITEQLDEIAAYADLGAFFNQPVKNYSTGMKQRLGFAVATRVKAGVLLIDEILSVGDAKFRKKSKKTMHEKLKSGETIVLVSHQTETIKQLCDRAIWIEDGVVQAEGDPQFVISSYESQDSNGK